MRHRRRRHHRNPVYRENPSTFTWLALGVVGFLLYRSGAFGSLVAATHAPSVTPTTSTPITGPMPPATIAVGEPWFDIPSLPQPSPLKPGVTGVTQPLIQLW